MTLKSQIKGRQKTDLGTWQVVTCTECTCIHTYTYTHKTIKNYSWF